MLIYTESHLYYTGVEEIDLLKGKEFRNGKSQKL